MFEKAIRSDLTEMMNTAWWAHSCPPPLFSGPAPTKLHSYELRGAAVRAECHPHNASETTSDLKDGRDGRRVHVGFAGILLEES